MLSLTEMTIAARLSGMDYGKYVHLLRHGFVTLPSMAEIRKRMVTIKTAVPQVARPIQEFAKENQKPLAGIGGDI